MAKSGHGAAGFDTARFRVRDQRERYDGLRVESGVVELGRGEVRRTVDGVTIGGFPSGMVYVEARVAAILDGEEDHSLRGPEDFERASVAALRIAGLSPGLEVGVGRADLASELRFENGRDGLDVLRAAASAELPWLKVGVEGMKDGRLETVYWRAARGRSIQLRLYDKGVETGTAEPGEWLRLERQRRYRKEREPAVSDLLGGSLRSEFIGRELAALVERQSQLHVCDEIGAQRRIEELVGSGEMSYQLGESLLGYVWLRHSGVPDRTARRRESQLRQYGLTLKRGQVERQVVELAEVVGRFADRWAA